MLLKAENISIDKGTHSKKIFENNVGAIFESEIHIKGYNFSINSIATIKTVKIVDSRFNFLFITVAIVALITSFTVFSTNLWIFMLSVLFFSFGLFYKKKIFYIQIIFTIAKKQYIQFTSSELQDIKILLREFTLHRASNSHLWKILD